MKAILEEPVDPQRRIWLIATSTTGGIAGVATLIAFIDSLLRLRAPRRPARALAC